MTSHLFRPLFLAVGFTAAASLGVSALGRGAADDQEPPAKKKATGPDDARAKKATGASLTNESLAALLDRMGYEYTTNTLSTGYVIYTITVDQDSWRFVLELSVSPNKAMVWVVAPLKPLPEAGTYPDEALVRLLRENWMIYPHTFCMPKDARRLYLQRAIENHDITAARVRSAIDAMVSTIRNTGPLWDTGKWGTKPAPGGGTADKKLPDGVRPDSPAALARAFDFLLLKAKFHKQDEMAEKVKEFVLPNHEAWFKRVFGPEVGADLAAEYEQGLPQMGPGVVRQVMTAIEEDQLRVDVRVFTQPDPDNAAPAQNRALKAMVTKVPLYSVWLTKSGEDVGLHVYSFVFADNGFRMVGKMKALGRSPSLRTSAPTGQEVNVTPMPRALTPGTPAPPFDESGVLPSGNNAASGRIPGAVEDSAFQSPGDSLLEENSIAPSFTAPQLLRQSQLGRMPGSSDAGPATNTLDPAHFRHLAPLMPPGARTGKPAPEPFGDRELKNVTPHSFW